MVWPLPVCLAEHHQGKARRLRLVLATLSHLTKAEISSLQDGPYLPGGTTEHGLVYGYAVDAMPTPEWLVITDGQQPEHWRLLHNSTGRGQRCSVGCSQRYQPTLNTVEQRKAQDYTFEALHRIYFYDAWRTQLVLGAPESDLVLPPQPGLLTQGCYWPQQSASDEVLSVSDIATEADAQACQTPTSPETADAVMTDEEANDIVSVLSSLSESSTLPSTVHQEEADSPMGDKDAEANPSDEAGDCLSNRPASSSTRPVNNDMLEENGEGSSAMPPQGVDPQDDSSPSHSSESPIKRRPGTKASAGRGQPKKLRQSAGQASKPPLGSIPEHGQQPVTLEDLANLADQMQESPVSRDPATPSEHPEEAQKCPQAMTEIDLDNDQRNVERGGTAATDIQLEADQRAMQALHVHQVAFHAAADADTKGMALPSLQLYSDLPREWPMARLCISNKQVNRLVRTFLWRRVAESALHGTSFGNIPEEINRDYIADLHRISEAFAAPLANLFAFAKQGHKLCSFIPQKQLALYANPLFWQYGLFAFVSRCCSHNNQHRRQIASAAKAALTKQEKSSEKDVDALTFMQTVIMSFVRGMEYGEQTLPINDLFVYFPVQLVPALVTAMEQQRFASVGVKGGCGYRPRKQGEEDNPLLVVGVYNKEIIYDRYPRTPDAQPVPVGGAELPQAETEEAAEEEDTVAEPTYTFAQGFGRFVIRYTRLATALGNFEQGSVQTESAAVAHWLTSGLKVAMARVGWNLLSPRYGLTRLPGDLLRLYYSQGYPQVQEDDRPYHQYGPIVYRGPVGRALCMAVW